MPFRHLTLVSAMPLLLAVACHAQLFGDPQKKITPRLQASLHGSGGDLVEFSPDGSLLFTAGNAESRLWKLPSGTPAFPAVTHNAEVEFAQFTPDGASVVTAHEFGVTRWDVRTNKPIGQPLHFPGSLLRVTVSKDGRLAAGSRRKGNEGDGADVLVFDVQTGKQLFSFPHKGEPEYLRFNSQNSLLICVEDLKPGAIYKVHRSVHLWDVRLGRALFEPVDTDFGGRYSRRYGAVPAAFSPDGTHVVIAQKATFEIWNLTGHRFADNRAFANDNLELSAVLYSRDGTTIVTRKHGMCTWDAMKASPLTSVVAAYLGEYNVSPDGTRVAGTIRLDNRPDGFDVGVWSFDSMWWLCHFNMKHGSKAISFSPDGKVVAASDGDSDNTLVWDLTK